MKFYCLVDVQVLIEALAAIKERSMDHRKINGSAFYLSNSALETFAKVEPVSVPEFDETTIKGQKRVVDHVKDENERIRKAMGGK